MWRLLGPHVPFVQLVQAFHRELTQPSVKRDRPVNQIFGQPLVSHHVDLLHHVRRIETGRQPAIEAQRDHPLQSGAMPRKQSMLRLLVAVTGIVEKFVGIGFSPAHGGALLEHYLPKTEKWLPSFGRTREACPRDSATATAPKVSTNFLAACADCSRIPQRRKFGAFA